jgi:hypothetical protein
VISLQSLYRHSKRGLTFGRHILQIYGRIILSTLHEAGNKCLLRTVLVHGRLETLVESAGPTLVAVCFVDRTASLQVAGCFARIYSITVNTSLEEPRTTYKIRSEYV